MNDTHYDMIDLPFYRQHVAPLLPEAVLDFHAHAWIPSLWKTDPWKNEVPGARYMVTERDYSLAALQADLKRMFADRRAAAVCFGYPTPACDTARTNDYIATAPAVGELHPLAVVGKGTAGPDELEAMIRRGQFRGYKVMLNWQGDDYGHIGVEDMIGPDEMALADRMGLVVLLHVPGAKRLADPRTQAAVERLSKSYPRASLVLAHCGRCYLPDEMAAAVGSLASLGNVYLDTSMVMDPTVLQIAIEGVGPSRVLFGTDLPVAAMRGRRVYVMDHWVDVVLEGYPASGYRVASAGINATFMVYEIVLAIGRAARLAGLDRAATDAIFWGNGIGLLRKAMAGR
jgi:hypothetical protein